MKIELFKGNIHNWLFGLVFQRDELYPLSKWEVGIELGPIGAVYFYSPKKFATGGVIQSPVGR